LNFDVSYWQILLKKSARAIDPNFSGTWACLPKKYGGPPRFLTIQRAALATAVRSLSAALVDHNAHCTDFRRLPFSEFFNNMGNDCREQRLLTGPKRTQ
jgi:hypothetical protein